MNAHPRRNIIDSNPFRAAYLLQNPHLRGRQPATLLDQTEVLAHRSEDHAKLAKHINGERAGMIVGVQYGLQAKSQCVIILLSNVYSCSHCLSFDKNFRVSRRH